MTRFANLLPLLRAVQETANRNCIYVMTRADGATKIGRSINPRKRRGSVAYTWQCNIRLVHSQDFGLNAVQAERVLHALFSGVRVDGEREWFRCDPQAACTALDALHSQLGCKTTPISRGYDEAAVKALVYRTVSATSPERRNYESVLKDAARRPGGIKWERRERACVVLETLGYIVRRHTDAGTMAVITDAGLLALSASRDA